MSGRNCVGWRFDVDGDTCDPARPESICLSGMCPDCGRHAFDCACHIERIDRRLRAEGVDVDAFLARLRETIARAKRDNGAA